MDIQNTPYQEETLDHKLRVFSMFEEIYEGLFL